MKCCDNAHIAKKNCASILTLYRNLKVMPMDNRSLYSNSDSECKHQIPDDKKALIIRGTIEF